MLSCIGCKSPAPPQTQTPPHVLVQGSEGGEGEVGGGRLGKLGMEELCDEVDSWSSSLTYTIDNKDTKRSQQVRMYIGP